MKLMKLLGHPITVIIIFSLVLISGESFGGFYLIYLLIALPHAGLHALLGIAGIVTMLIGYRFTSSQLNWRKPIFYLTGICLMILSLYIFFQRSKGYNDNTFEQAVPIISFCLFGMCVLLNLFLVISLLLKVKRKDQIGLST